MKLRFRKNSLRLRVNQREVESLAGGSILEEQVHFPGNSTMSYVLQPVSDAMPNASFHNGVIRIGAPQEQLQSWAATDSIGIYFEFPAEGNALKVAIEKDLVCVDGPEEERDPHAYPRTATAKCQEPIA
jgi:hypothetical protein